MSVVTRLACVTCFWIAAITDLRGELPSLPKDSIPLVFSKKHCWPNPEVLIQAKTCIFSHPDLFSGR